MKAMKSLDRSDAHWKFAANTNHSPQQRQATKTSSMLERVTFLGLNKVQYHADPCHFGWTALTEMTTMTKTMSLAAANQSSPSEPTRAQRLRWQHEQVSSDALQPARQLCWQTLEQTREPIEGKSMSWVARLRVMVCRKQMQRQSRKRKKVEWMWAKEQTKWTARQQMKN